jgi:bacteriocin-like protein
MPKSTKTNPKKTAPKKGAAEKIRQGKVELSDEELTKVSGGQQSNKRFTCIE